MNPFFTFNTVLLSDIIDVSVSAFIDNQVKMMMFVSVTSSDVYNVALRCVTVISVCVCRCLSLSLSPRCSRFQLLITWEGGLAPRWTSHPLKDTLLRKTRERERTRPKECVPLRGRRCVGVPPVCCKVDH